MFGGFAITLDVAVSKHTIDLILQCVHSVWPDGILELDIPFFEVTSLPEGFKRSWQFPSGFFLYKSMEVYSYWTKYGRTDCYADDVIYIEAELDSITFVVDSDRSPTLGLIDMVRDMLQRN